jgi:ankyrin repeat protein
MQKIKLLSRSGRVWAGVIFAAALLTLAGCAQSRSEKPTPDAAKRFLKLRGYDFNDKSFLRAVTANDVSAVDGFLAAGINPNLKDEESGTTALISAAIHDQGDLVNVLLRGGADVNVKDMGGYNALLRALEKKNDAIADLLLSQPGLEVNAQGFSGMTALMWYVGSEQETKVQDLLARGADANLSDADGDTALHTAAMRGNVKLLQILLAAGANPNARNKVGGTPLMWAGTFGNEEVAQILIDKGADAALKDELGMTASAWAAKNKRDEFAQLLRAAEKKR